MPILVQVQGGGNILCRPVNDPLYIYHMNRIIPFSYMPLHSNISVIDLCCIVYCNFFRFTAPQLIISHHMQLFLNALINIVSLDARNHHQDLLCFKFRR